MCPDTLFIITYMQFTDHDNDIKPARCEIGVMAYNAEEALARWKAQASSKQSLIEIKATQVTSIL